LIDCDLYNGAILISDKLLYRNLLLPVLINLTAATRSQCVVRSQDGYHSFAFLISALRTLIVRRRVPLCSRQAACLFISFTGLLSTVCDSLCTSGHVLVCVRQPRGRPACFCSFLLDILCK